MFFDISLKIKQMKKIVYFMSQAFASIGIITTIVMFIASSPVTAILSLMTAVSGYLAYRKIATGYNNKNEFRFDETMILSSAFQGVIALVSIIYILAENSIAGYTMLFGVGLFSAFVSMFIIERKKKRKNMTVMQKLEYDSSLSGRVAGSIEQCRRDRQQLKSEIEKLKWLTYNTINDVYGDLAENKKTIVADFEKLENKHKKKLNYQLVNECNNLVSGYKNQIKTRLSKIKVCKQLEDEYVETQKKLIYLEEKKLEQQSREKHDANKLERLKNYRQQLSEMDESLELEATYKIASDLDGIDSEIDELKTEFELKEEYFKQLNILSREFADTSNIENSDAFEKELDKISKKITEK